MEKNEESPEKSITSSNDKLPNVEFVTVDNGTVDVSFLDAHSKILVSDENELGVYSKELKYEESKGFHTTRAIIGSLFLLWGFGTLLIPFFTGSTPSIISGLIIVPDSWRRNIIKLLKRMPYVGRKLCPTLERIEDFFEDQEMSFFQKLRKRN